MVLSSLIYIALIIIVIIVIIVLLKFLVGVLFIAPIAENIAVTQAYGQGMHLLLLVRCTINETGQFKHK
jgi:site-specific recombinase